MASLLIGHNYALSHEERGIKVNPKKNCKMKSKEKEKRNGGGGYVDFNWEVQLKINNSF